MTLSFEEKKAIFDSYVELEVVPVSLKRLNYHFNDSAVAKTVLVRHLHPNGNVFIYAGYLPKEETQKGYVSVLNADEETLREWVDKAIAHLKKTIDGYVDGYFELWRDAQGDVLRLTYENPVWSVLVADGQVEGVFKTKEAGEGYLHDEGFEKG